MMHFFALESTLSSEIVKLLSSALYVLHQPHKYPATVHSYIGQPKHYDVITGKRAMYINYQCHSSAPGD